MAILLAAALTAAGGCNVVGVAANALYPERIKPAYVPVKTAPLLVLVENRQNPGMVVPEAEELAGYITQELEQQQVAPIVPASKLEELRDRDPQGARKMSISEIGKAVEAQQVLYVDIVSLQQSDVVGMPTTGAVDLRVHMVDPNTGKTLWPTGTYPLHYQTTATAEAANGQDRQLRTNLLRGAARSVARLFFEWDPEGEAQ